MASLRAKTKNKTTQPVKPPGGEIKKFIRSVSVKLTNNIRDSYGSGEVSKQSHAGFYATIFFGRFFNLCQLSFYGPCRLPVRTILML